MTILTQSMHYIICHEYEVVYLIRISDNKKVVIGDFYGDPSCALITNNERHCYIGGCGLIIYNICEPFENYEYDKKTTQWSEFFRDKGNILWIEDIYFGDIEKEIKINVDSSDLENGGLYVFDLEKHFLKRILV